jgi:ribosome-associated protein
VAARPEYNGIIEAKQKALAAARAAQDIKGQNLTIIDLSGVCSYTDYLVIVTAYSDRQTHAIGDGVVDDLKKAGIRPLAREGQGSWILIDFGDVIVHVFHEDARAFYDLDKLWSDAPRLPVPPPTSVVAAS